MSSLADINNNIDPNRNGVQLQQGQPPVASAGNGQDRFAPVNANAAIVNGSHNPPIPSASQALLDQLKALFPRHKHLIHDPLSCPINVYSGPLDFGSYGAVMRATLRTHDGREIPVAKKMFYSPDPAYLECKHYLDLDHPNILKCFGFTVTEGPNPNVCLLLELGSASFASRFAFDRSSTQSPRVPFSAIKAKESALQIARGLAHLHVQRGVVHADLKHHNIIIVQDVLKIGDLGSAKAAGSPLDTSVASTTKSFAPPEFMDRFNLNSQLLLHPSFDVFSFGVILASVVGVDPNAIQVSAADPHPRRSTIELVRRCLNTEAGNRPQDAGEIVSILEGISDDDDERNDNNNDDDDDHNDDRGADARGDGNGDDDNGSKKNNNDRGAGGNRTDSTYKHDATEQVDELWTNEQFLGLRYKFVAEEAIKLSFQEETSSRLSSVVFSQTIDDSSHPLFANFMKPKIHSKKYKLENFRMLRSSFLSSAFLGAHKYDHERLLDNARQIHPRRTGIHHFEKEQYLEDPSKIGPYPRLSRILFAWHATSTNEVGDVLTHGPSRRGFGIDGVFYLDADRALDPVCCKLEDKRLILYAVSVSQVGMSEDNDDAKCDLFDAWLNSEIGELTIDYRWRALPVSVSELSFVKKNEVEGTTK